MYPTVACRSRGVLTGRADWRVGRWRGCPGAALPLHVGPVRGERAEVLRGRHHPEKPAAGEQKPSQRDRINSTAWSTETNTVETGDDADETGDMESGNPC